MTKSAFDDRATFIYNVLGFESLFIDDRLQMDGPTDATAVDSVFALSTRSLLAAALTGFPNPPAPGLRVASRTFPKVWLGAT